jgi:hypothetical protein
VVEVDLEIAKQLASPQIFPVAHPLGCELPCGTMKLIGTHVALIDSGLVRISREELRSLGGTDPESYITEHTSV